MREHLESFQSFLPAAEFDWLHLDPALYSITVSYTNHRPFLHVSQALNVFSTKFKMGFQMTHQGKKIL